MRKSFAVLLITLVLTQICLASVYERQTLNQLVNQSNLIVEGKITEIQSRWNDKKTMIYTDVQVAIDDFVKGTDTQRKITVRLIGGRVGNKAVYVLGHPTFQVGEHALLMLQELNKNYLSNFIGSAETEKLGKAFQIIGSGQGKFKIINDPESGKLIKQDVENMDFINSISTEEVNEFDRTSLSKFKNAIKEIIRLDTKQME